MFPSNLISCYLQPQNFLLDGGPLPKVKIIDFGSARELTADKPVTHHVYGSPEFSGTNYHLQCLYQYHRRDMDLLTQQIDNLSSIVC